MELGGADSPWHAYLTKCNSTIKFRRPWSTSQQGSQGRRIRRNMRAFNRIFPLLKRRQEGLKLAISLGFRNSAGQNISMKMGRRFRVPTAAQNLRWAIKQKIAAIRRWHRTFSRPPKPARRSEALHPDARSVRRFFAHRACHAAAKQDEDVPWPREGASAKPGLSSALMRASWGKTKAHSADKASQAGKLSVAASAPRASLACAAFTPSTWPHRPCSPVRAVGPRTTPMRTPIR